MTHALCVLVRPITFFIDLNPLLEQWPSAGRRGLVGTTGAHHLAGEGTVPYAVVQIYSQHTAIYPVN